MNIKKLMSMLVTLFLLGTSMFIAIPTSAGELYTIRGDVYIGNELAPAGIEIKLSFTDGNETNITSNIGQYQIDFEEPLHEYKGGYFFVYYDGVWQTPINNKTTDEITPTQIFYNYDLYLLSVPNNPPYTPRNSIPPHNSMNVSININLSWIGGDPDQVDTVTYDVYFGTNNSPPLMVHNQSGTSYNPGIMSHNTTYYWKIKAWDDSDVSATGPEWDFTTEEEPMYSPVVTEIPDQSISKDSTFAAISAYTLSTNWILFDTDPNEAGTSDDFRDVQYAYYYTNDEYLYYRMECYGFPNFTLEPEGRYKWFIDTDYPPNMERSGGNVYEAEFLFFVEDTPKPGGDGIGEIYLLYDVDGDGFMDDDWPDHANDPGPINDSTIANYSIQDHNISLYINLTNLSNPSNIM